MDLLDRCLSSSTLKCQFVNDITEGYEYDPSRETSFLGEGSFGKVYRMRRKCDQKLFAVKILEKGRVAKSSDSVQHVMVEIIVTTSIKRTDTPTQHGGHEGFCYTEQVLYNTTCIFLVMDLLEGKYHNTKENTLLEDFRGPGLRNRLYHYYLKYDHAKLTEVERIAQGLEQNVLQKKEVFEKPEPSHSGDLYTYLDSHRFMGVPREKISVIFKSLCKTLQFLHSHHVVHRDLKPENLMVVEDRTYEESTAEDGTRKIILRDRITVKVIDYGLAKIMYTPGTPSPLPDPTVTPPILKEMQAAVVRPVLSKASENFDVPDVTPCGTDVYSASEALAGLVAGKKWASSSETLPKLDVWAAGVILYCLYYGRLPFNVPKRTMPQNLTEVQKYQWEIQERRRKLQTLQQMVSVGLMFPNVPDDVPNDVKDFMKKLTAINMKERPTSAEVLEDPILKAFPLGTTVVYEIVFKPDGTGVERIDVLHEDENNQSGPPGPGQNATEVQTRIDEENRPLDDGEEGRGTPCLTLMRDLQGEGGEKGDYYNNYIDFEEDHKLQQLN